MKCKTSPDSSGLTLARALGLSTTTASRANKLRRTRLVRIKRMSRELNFILALLALGRFLSAQFRLDEHVDLAIHHFLDIARRGAGAVIFHHLIRLENVGANLIA